MQHVQNSETKLEDKKKHCKNNVLLLGNDKMLIMPNVDANVVKAFESALALLEG